MLTIHFNKWNDSISLIKICRFIVHSSTKVLIRLFLLIESIITFFLQLGQHYLIFYCHFPALNCFLSFDIAFHHPWLSIQELARKHHRMKIRHPIGVQELFLENFRAQFAAFIKLVRGNLELDNLLRSIGISFKGC